MSALKPSLTVTIDGKPHRLPEGLTILDALRAAGAAVPHVCHDDRVAAVGACRLCVVRVAGHARPVASCTTPLADGMAIETRTAALERLRATNLSLIAGRYPRDAFDTAPGHPFHQLLAEYAAIPPPAGQAEAGQPCRPTTTIRTRC